MHKQTYSPEDITEVEFEVGGFHTGMTKYHFIVTETGSILSTLMWMTPITEIGLSNYETVEMQKKISALKTENWKKYYNNPDIQDGTQWSLIITYNGEKPVEYGGSNAYPSKWDDLIAIFGYDFKD